MRVRAWVALLQSLLDARLCYETDVELRGVQVHGPARGFRERPEAADVHGVQGGQVTSVLLPPELLLCAQLGAALRSADTACTDRYCSPKCQRAAWKRAGHREACRGVQEAAGQEPAEA